jgi:hypothetical protein
MNSFEAYKMYLAIKMHFTSKSYNYFQYNGKVRAKVETFEKRRDNYQFKKLARHKDLEGLIVSNFVAQKIVSPYDLNTSVGEEIFLGWRRRLQSISYTFSEEIKVLKEPFKDNFVLHKDGSLPDILTLFLQKKISLETLTILLYTTNAIDYYDRKIQNNTVWANLSMKVRKYKPFFKFESKKMKEIIKQNFSELVK